MGYGFTKSKGVLDGRVMKQKVERTKEKDEELHEEGEKFLRDKEALERHYQIIENSSLSAEDKRHALEELKNVLVARQKDFEKNIIEKREELQEQQKEEIEKYEAGIDEIAQETAELKGIRFEANSVDAMSVIETLDEKGMEFERQKNEAKEKLKLQMEQAQRQYRDMRNKKF